MAQRVVIPGFRKIETSSDGGEGGTTNYNDLTNKPSINNVPLVGNLRTSNLKLTDATLTEEGVPAEAKTVGAKLAEQSTSLIALSEQLGNHTVKSDVPTNAVFTDTVYDDTEVKEEIAGINSNLDALGKCKNLLNPTLQTTTINGVTCTNNGDGTYTLDTGGSESSDTVNLFICGKYLSKEKVINSTGKLKFVFSNVGVDNVTGQLLYYNEGLVSGTNGFIINVSDSRPITLVNLQIIKGTILDNVLIKPMITTNLNATYDDFVPYTGDGDTLMDDVASINNDLAPKKIELQNVDEKVTIQDNGSFIINGFAFVNLLVTFNETLPQWSNFVRLPRPKGGNVSVYCENSVRFIIYSQDNLPGDCGTYDEVSSGTEIRLLVNYEVA